MKNLDYLADYVNDEEGKNFFVRPNMVIAVSMPYSMLDKEQMKKILDIADKELVTPRGLRTLSPGNIYYKGSYTGNRKRGTGLIIRVQSGHGFTGLSVKDG